MLTRLLYVSIVSTALAGSAFSQTTPPSTSASITAPVLYKSAPAKLSEEKIPTGAKVYIAPLNGYESFLTAALVKKGAPVVIVNNPDKADYQITGVSESVQAGWSKMLMFGSEQSNEQASI